MTSGTAFDNYALTALRAHPGQWNCLPCWAREAGLNAPEDTGRLRMLAGRLRFSREHELTRAGFCGRCGTMIFRAGGVLPEPGASRRVSTVPEIA
jgi:hypothetical protein